MRPHHLDPVVYTIIMMDVDWFFIELINNVDHTHKLDKI